MATRGGPGLTQDSANYLAMAAGLVRDGTAVGVSGNPVTVFPAGFPALLAIGDAVGLGDRGTEGLLWVRLVLAVSAAATVWCTAWIARRHVHDRRWAVVAAVAVAVSPTLLLVWSSAWSEGPFVAVLAVFLVAVDVLWSERGAANRSRMRWIAVAVAAAWAVTALRYVGVVTVPVLAVVVAAGSQPLRWRGLRRGVLAGAAAAVVPACLLIRNIAVDGTVAGARNGHGRPLVEVVTIAAGTAGGWVVPFAPPLGLLVVVLVVGCLAVRCRLGLLAGVLADLAPLVVTALLLLAVLAVSDASTSIDGLDDRLLSGLVVPVVLVVVLVGDRLRSDGDRSMRRAVVAAGVVWVVLVAPASVWRVLEPPASLVRTPRTTSAIVGLARRLPRDAVVFSNRPEAVWLTTMLDAVHAMPTSIPRGWESADAGARSFQHVLACAGGTGDVLWFDDLTWPGWIGPEHLPEGVRVEVIRRVGDGSLLRVTDGASGGQRPDDCDG